jgi:membrane-associated phospholipid phosphatase
MTSALTFAIPLCAAAQSANNPGYFLPPTDGGAEIGPSDGAVVNSHSIGDTSPIIDSRLVDTLPPPSSVSYNAPLPWYETDWGVLGIGIAATGATMIFDHGINQYTETHLSHNFRDHYALRAADALELAPLVFAGLTMVQSPISDPELAHASSIAMTAAAAVTVETMGIKYVVGRDRPSGPNSDPFIAHPFDASRSSFSLGAVFPGFGTPTSSFPSGHTALAMALVTPYAELYHEPILYAIPVAVGVGRIAAIDGHWASDVVGGAFIGWLTADLTRRLFPDSDYGLMLFGDGQSMSVGINGRF